MKKSENINSISLSLLREWCDRLIDLQITSSTNSGVYGGILCEACGHIHGRIADAIYPLCVMYSKTGDKKYLDSATLLFDWTENNVTAHRGFHVNDVFNAWRGITLFYIIALGETLLELGDILPQAIKKKWYSSFIKTVNSIKDDALFFPGNDAQIAVNYPVAYLTAMAVAGALTNNSRFFALAAAQEDNVLSFVSESGWLFGETLGRYVSPSGCRAIDLGYNVEESVGNLALYGILAKRDRFIDIATKMLEQAARFMLPDGAWDNSWGSRAVKWTYYGSRTSDGCQTACTLLQDKNPLFAELCIRNTLLLQNMTHNGLLTGGAMYTAAGYGACAHHTFCHAKAVAHVVQRPFKNINRCALPRDAQNGIYKLPESGVTLVSVGNWRATMQSNDLYLTANQEISGGAPSFIYHMKAGPLFTGNGVKFAMPEVANMQMLRETENICQTIRISRGNFTSQYCKYSEISERCENGVMYYSARGQLTDINGNTDCTYRIFYTFEGNSFNISTVCDKQAVLQLPVICAPNAAAKRNDYSCRFSVNNCTVTVTSDRRINFITGYEHDRLFNSAGGFCALPLTIDLEQQDMVKINVTVTEKNRTNSNKQV